MRRTDPLRMTPSWHAAHDAGRARDRHGIDGRDGDLRRARGSLDAGSPGRCARAGISATDRIAVLMENNRPFLEVTVGGAALGAPLHRDQQPPASGGGAVRPRRLRGARARDAPRRWRRRRGTRPLAHSRCACPPRATLPGFERYDDVLAGASPEPLERRARGPRDALLVGHDRAAEGRAQGAARHAVRRSVGGAGPDRAGDRHVRRRARLRVPVACAAVPRRAARVLDVDAPPRRGGRRDGAVRPARSAWS